MSRYGATYSRGRVAADTIEAGTSRVAGQFARLASCTVRASERVQIPAPTDETAFAVVVYLDPDNAHDGAGQPASGYVLDWRASADERVTLYYDKGNARWTLEVRHLATTQTVTLADTFTAAAPTAIYLAGDATTLYLAVDGGAIGAGTARTQIPTGLPSTMDVGSVAGASQFLAAYGAVVVCSAPLTQTQWEGLAGLRAVRPPVLGECGLDGDMSGLWYGAHAVAWTLPASGACLDLNDTDGQERFLTRTLSGTGIGPSLHRVVESPLRDGVAYIDTRGRSRLVVADLMVVSRSTFAHLWDLRREVAQALNPRLGEGLLMIAPGEEIYETPALVADGGASMDEMLGGMVTVAPIPFLCSGADWRSAVRTEDDDAIPAAGWAFPWAFPWEWSESAVGLLVANAGDVPVYPVIVFTAGGSGCTVPAVTNDTTGKTIAMRTGFAMAAGEVLVIDMDARTVTLEGVSAMNERDPESEMWALAPGDNSIEARVASGTATVEVRHEPRYVGV